MDAITTDLSSKAESVSPPEVSLYSQSLHLALQAPPLQLIQLVVLLEKTGIETRGQEKNKKSGDATQKNVENKTK